jgi:hypothetical protein
VGGHTRLVNATGEFEQRINRLGPSVARNWEVDLAETIGAYCEWVAAQKKLKLPSAAALDEARKRKMVLRSGRAATGNPYSVR